MGRRGYVYILASRKNGTLYVGVTSDLSRRLEEHRNGIGSAFTRRYGVTRLVWFEEHDLVSYAIQREKTIKKWPRQWKINAIEAINPHWHDIGWWLLYALWRPQADLCGSASIFARDRSLTVPVLSRERYGRL